MADLLLSDFDFGAFGWE